MTGVKIYANFEKKVVLSTAANLVKTNNEKFCKHNFEVPHSHFDL